MMVKKLAIVFLSGFILNWIWEFFHSVLYLSYQGGGITSFILLRATFFDGLMILGLVIFAWKLKRGKNWFLLIMGLILAIAIEKWALSSGRWVYAESMPIIPILNVGLTPTIQLALTSLMSKKSADLLTRKK